MYSSSIVGISSAPAAAEKIKSNSLLSSIFNGITKLNESISKYPTTALNTVATFVELSRVSFSAVEQVRRTYRRRTAQQQGEIAVIQTKFDQNKKRLNQAREEMEKI
jgi:hypothetical protein